MKKRLMAKIISAVMIVSFITVNGGIQPIVAKAAVNLASGGYSCEIDGITWTYEVDYEGNAINVCPSDNSEVSGMVKIPETLEGNRVISIKDSAFQWNTRLTNIEIPEGVTSIGNSAFYYCTSLSNLKIPESVTRIGYFAFYKCDSLLSVYIPTGLESIGDNAFYNCKNLKELLVAENNRDYISLDGVLYNKEKTEIINYPTKKEGEKYIIQDSVTKISSEAFFGCENLLSIIIPKGVTIIEGNTFTNCTNLESIIITEGVTEIRDGAFLRCTSLTNIVIPEGVTKIDSYAFSECTSLKSISLPNSITNISWDAFENCTNLTIIYANDGSYASYYPWGDGINVITEASINGIKADAVGTLEAINVALSSYTTVGGLETNTVYQDLKMTLDKYPTSELIETETDMAKLISWLNEAVVKITALYVEIEKVNSSIIWDYEIGASGIINLAPRTEVSGCVIIPDTIDGRKVISLRPYAFKDNKELISVIIPEGITNIEYCLFSGCTGLTSLSFPNSIDTITWNAFDNCTSLSTIYANKESFARALFWGKEITVDTNTGYISESTIKWLKDSVVSNIEETDKALSDYIKAGGLETDDVYKNLKTTVDIFPTVESIEAEADITKLVNWISKTDTDIITIYSEIEKLKELITEFTTSVTSPQVVGTGITLNAKSSGGEGVLQTKFEVSEGTVMRVLKDYSTEDKAVWTPTEAGIYTIKALVKDSTGIYVEKELTYVVYDQVNLNSVTIDQGSSIDLGKSVNIITDAVGGNGKLSYSISAENNGTIEKISDLSQNTTATWTPAKAGVWNITATVVDESGNKSEKQVTLEVKNIAKNETTIYYKGYSTPYIHYKVGTGSWSLVPGVAMIPTTEMVGYTHKITVDLGTASTLIACFNNGYGSWDSRNGANYTFNAGTYDYSNGIITKVQEPVKTLTINSFTSSIEGKVAIGKSVVLTGNATSDASTIEYKMSVINSKNETTVIKDFSTSNIATWTPSVAGDYTLVLDVTDSKGNTATTQMKLQGYDVTSNLTTIYYKGYTTPYIHYRVGTGSWTLAPGVPMTPTTEMLGYTHKITIDLGTSSALTACFNNGSGSWDSKNGANYTFNAGTYDYSNGTITKVQEPVKTLTINGFTSNIIGKLNVGTSVILAGIATSDASTIEYKMSVINPKNETKVIKEYSTSNIGTWTPSEAGEFTLVLEAKDSNGKTARTEMKVQAYVVSSHITTIYYKGYTTPYIHYKVGTGSWTSAPGIAMTPTSEKAGYTHKITIDLGDADTLTACFNNGSGSWDSKSGANYTFNSGTYTYSNGNNILINK